jgi:decaprenylphospho-beta-D-erythro-pentofuranosid-2-ulose 2-reductase
VLRTGSKDRTRQAAEGGAAGPPGRVLLIGGTSEIGLAILAALQLGPTAEVLLAGRNAERLEAAAGGLPCRTSVLRYDAAEPGAGPALAAAAFSDGPVDLVISAAGVLTPQESLDQAPDDAGVLIETNFTSHVTALLALTARMRAAGRGTVVILSSVAAVRPRKANFVYGAAKAGLDAFGRGLADSLHGSGVRVLLIRPGFVIGRMTAGMEPAPLSTTPEQVGAAVAAGLAGRASLIWVPRSLGPAAMLMRLMPRRFWRQLRR